MAEYDYRKGKERIEDILDNELKVIEQNEVPTDSAFTFSNGYYSWVSAIFVDMRDSSTLFAGEDKEKVSKIITSSPLSILKFILLLATISLSPDLYRLKELHISI